MNRQTSNRFQETWAVEAVVEFILCRWWLFYRRQSMQESSVYKHLVETADEERYQQGIQQGTEQGARQSTIRDLSAVLEFSV